MGEPLKALKKDVEIEQLKTGQLNN